MFNMGANNSISVNRGDTFSIPLFINVGSEYDPEQYAFPGDGEIYLGLMEPNQLFEDAILKKKYDSSNINEEGNIVIEFNSDAVIPAPAFIILSSLLVNFILPPYLHLNGLK